jgi:hypothetical protein
MHSPRSCQRRNFMDFSGECAAAELAAAAPVLHVLPRDCSVPPMGVPAISAIRVRSSSQKHPFLGFLHLYPNPVVLADTIASGKAKPGRGYLHGSPVYGPATIDAVADAGDSSCSSSGVACRSWHHHRRLFRRAHSLSSWPSDSGSP